MNRRRFLARLGGAFVAALSAPTLLELLPAPAAPPLAFRSDALGISMRFIEKFDLVKSEQLYRFDVLYGIGNCTPEWSCRVLDRSMPEPGGFARYLEADRAIQTEVINAELWAKPDMFGRVWEA